MIICVCHRISDRDIARAVEAGCGSFDELQERSRVGTACGRCLEHAHDTFAAHGDCGRCVGAGHCGATSPVLAAA